MESQQLLLVLACIIARLVPPYHCNGPLFIAGRLPAVGRECVSDRADEVC